MPSTQIEGRVPPSPSGSPPGLHAYPSLRPSMGRGTRPPRSKAEVMLSSWSSPGSQSPPKAVRKRLASVEGSTSSTSWLRTRNSAWYGIRGPRRTRLVPQAAPSPARILPKLPLTQAPLKSSQTPSFLPNTPYITGPKCPSATLIDCQQSSQEDNSRGFRGCSAPHDFPSLPFHTHPSRGDPPRLALVGWGWVGIGDTFWVPNQQHQPLPGGVEVVPVVGYDLEGMGNWTRRWG